MSFGEIAEEFGLRTSSIVEAVDRAARLVAMDDALTVAGVMAGERAAERWNGAVAAAAE
jgi:hypothetical protein